LQHALWVDGQIVLLEGNYLLLNEDGWCDLSTYADYTISITADEALLRSRLIGRKNQNRGGRGKSDPFCGFQRYT